MSCLIHTEVDAKEEKARKIAAMSYGAMYGVQIGQAGAGSGSHNNHASNLAQPGTPGTPGSLASLAGQFKTPGKKKYQYCFFNLIPEFLLLLVCILLVEMMMCRVRQVTAIETFNRSE